MYRLIRSLTVPALTLLGVLTYASSTRAQVFTNRALFTAALSGVSVETFATNQTLVAGNNTYNGIGINIAGTSVGGNSISGGLYNGDIFTNPTSITFTFSSPVRGFGADFTSAATASGINVSIAGTTYVLSSSLPNPGTGFFGVISSTDFTTVTLTSGPPPNEIFSLDNLTRGSAPVTVPEAGSLALMVIPIGAVVIYKRRRK